MTKKTDKNVKLQQLIGRQSRLAKSDGRFVVVMAPCGMGKTKRMAFENSLKEVMSPNGVMVLKR